MRVFNLIKLPNTKDIVVKEREIYQQLISQSWIQRDPESPFIFCLKSIGISIQVNWNYTVSGNKWWLSWHFNDDIHNYYKYEDISKYLSKEEKRGAEDLMKFLCSISK